jgi:hypothetical protein
MLKTHLDDELAFFLAEDLQCEHFYPNPIRKNSFIDLLTPPSGIPKDASIEIHTDLSDWELPEVPSIRLELCPQEINVEDLLDLQCPKKPEIKVSVTIAKPSPSLIGTLTLEQRKEKIEKYLAKRKKRTWQKRIYYDCRKKVADKRLRIKGRFVTKDQVISKFGADALKNLL